MDTALTMVSEITSSGGNRAGALPRDYRRRLESPLTRLEAIELFCGQFKQFHHIHLKSNRQPLQPIDRNVGHLAFKL